VDDTDGDLDAMLAEDPPPALKRLLVQHASRRILTQPIAGSPAD
jgi:hypothetical protein